MSWFEAEVDSDQAKCLGRRPVHAIAPCHGPGPRAEHKSRFISGGLGPVLGSPCAHPTWSGRVAGCACDGEAHEVSGQASNGPSRLVRVPLSIRHDDIWRENEERPRPLAPLQVRLADVVPAAPPAPSDSRRLCIKYLLSDAVFEPACPGRSSAQTASHHCGQRDRRIRARVEPSQTLPGPGTHPITPPMDRRALRSPGTRGRAVPGHVPRNRAYMTDRPWRSCALRSNL